MACLLAAVMGTPVTERETQDKKLKQRGLYRYRIPGDGNCLFRAVAFGLQLDQERAHVVLREATVNWMREHCRELMEQHLIDSEKDIDDIKSPGMWVGQAAVVILAHMLGVTITVYYGGDKGPLDVQHFCPKGESSSKEIKLVYMYGGHYDAVVDKPDVPNPEFELWQNQQQLEIQASEDCARKLQEELTADTDMNPNTEEVCHETLLKNSTTDDSKLTNTVGDSQKVSKGETTGRQRERKSVEYREIPIQYLDSDRDVSHRKSESREVSRRKVGDGSTRTGPEMGRLILSPQPWFGVLPVGMWGKRDACSWFSPGLI